MNSKKDWKKLEENNSEELKSKKKKVQIKSKPGKVKIYKEKNGNKWRKRKYLNKICNKDERKHERKG